MHAFLARRPDEHGKTTILRRDQRDGVALVKHELCRCEMARPAEQRRMNDRRFAPFDWLGDAALFDERRTLPPGDFRAESQHLAAIRENRRAVHRREPGESNPSSVVSIAGQSGSCEACSSMILL